MEKSRFNLVIPFEILIKNNIDHLDWFILYCCFKKDNKLILDYIKEYKPISTNKFLNLEERGFILLKNKKEITLESISLTDISKLLFTTNSEEFKRLFNELLETYPKKVPSAEGRSVRRLQLNLNRCRNLYEKILDNTSDRLELHNKILKAIKVMYIEHEKGRRLAFIQLLETFLHQKSFEVYFNTDNELDNISDNGENKTILGGDF